MPRPPRVEEPGTVYHVTDRGNGRATIFHKDADFAAFERVLGEGLARHPVDLLTYCLMGNHWHLVVVSRAGRALSDLMRWVGVTHVRRHHEHYATRGGGHLYQGRYKSFPVQCDRHLLLVLRYVEANALRAGRVGSAADWPWGGLAARAAGGKPFALADWPLDRPADWPAVVDAAIDPSELDRLRRRHVNRGQPFGSEVWAAAAAGRLGLRSTMRSVGRPRRAEI